VEPLLRRLASKGHWLPDRPDRRPPWRGGYHPRRKILNDIHRPPTPAASIATIGLCGPKIRASAFEKSAVSPAVLSTSMKFVGGGDGPSGRCCRGIRSRKALRLASKPAMTELGCLTAPMNPWSQPDLERCCATPCPGSHLRGIAPPAMVAGPQRRRHPPVSAIDPWFPRKLQGG